MKRNKKGKFATHGQDKCDRTMRVTEKEKELFLSLRDEKTMGIKKFRMCKGCIDKNKLPDELIVSSSDFDYCSTCGDYKETVGVMVTTVELMHQEHCDCGDQIRHNNGGNYHYTTYKADHRHTFVQRDMKNCW